MDDVVWTSIANRDLADIGEFIAQDDPSAAERTVRHILEQVMGLAFYPSLGRPGRIEGTRELVISGTPYIVAYRIRERIEIVTVLHAAQSWPDTL